MCWGKWTKVKDVITYLLVLMLSIVFISMVLETESKDSSNIE